ncbi:uncharacterized protein LOC132622092 [Lycium barbarum]|uniref:uncharacterized protein LOC132622092 n=1 Tax=Lycium barbarum TaxID=112863 RepID=UPI00293EE60B|nr:uncharacterized protein LOC132622092 [Lycium barbarum]
MGYIHEDNLRARKKFGFVAGTIKKPDEESPGLEDWWTIKSLLVSWIRHIIEPMLHSIISHKEEAKELWTSIRERFAVIDCPRMQQLKAELAECKKNGRTIVDYYGRLTKLWEKLTNYEQIPTYKCGKCTCNLGTALETKREEEKVHLFLMGMDEAMYGMCKGKTLTVTKVMKEKTMMHSAHNARDPDTSWMDVFNSLAIRIGGQEIKKDMKK